MNTTIAERLDSAKLAQLMELAGAAELAEASMPEMHQPRPQEPARRTGFDLSNYTDAELGRLVREGLLTAKAAEMHDAVSMPDLTQVQARKVAALMETLGWKHARAVTFVIEHAA